MPSIRHNPQESIERNIKAHDNVAAIYDLKHIEIYNPTEQNRIKSTLQEAVSLITTLKNRPKVLDFGSGTGNLTQHLLTLPTNVIAGDVSRQSLDLLNKKIGGHKHLTTTTLNGKDLIDFPDNSFDMVATYSVLHHVPDYLGIIDEFVRVTKPGGVILIDHEVCPSYWEKKNHYLCYLSELGKNFLNIYQLEMGSFNFNSILAGNSTNPLVILENIRKISRYGYNLFRQLIPTKPVITDECDLHTSINDHIEWQEIKDRLLPHCTITRQEDYLVCRENNYPPMIWNK
ncbi:MAG TPA: class I SAM-dependent methyltransferase, partial [Bacteroidetes bacterium]|nr:class I SAM-dependent methyltransferase [Bacteroidota bacterium]